MTQQQPDFDSIKQISPYGVEYWSARDLMPKLGYGNGWRNFEAAIKKAMISCEQNEQIVAENMPEPEKTAARKDGTR